MESPNHQAYPALPHPAVIDAMKKETKNTGVEVTSDVSVLRTTLQQLTQHKK